MAAETHSFIDIAALDAVRGHFAAGDAVVILTADLARVLWANGPGAALLGFSGIEAAIDGDSGLSRTARRQIEATPGFPEIGADRAISVRLAAGMSSQAVMVRASHLTLRGDDAAIMLVVPFAASSTRSPQEIAARAVSGFDEPGGYLALLAASGELLAATDGFDALGIDAEARAAIVSDVAGERDRLIKRLIHVDGRTLPIGLARLADDPAVHLLITVDERDGAEELPAAAPNVAANDSQAEITAAAPVEIAGDLADQTAPQADSAAGEAPDAEVAEDETATPSPAEAQADNDDGQAWEDHAEPGAPLRAPGHDNWYFSSSGSDSATADAKAPTDTSKNDAPPPADQQPKPAAVADVDRDAPPVRFVWRTDAEGRFSAISPEFATAVGAEAADVVGQGFNDVAKRLALDPAGEIAGLLERRDTWSGRSVFWPIAGTDFKAPVDLAALPAYGRERQFEGFRGFGVARPAEAVVDPLSIGMSLTGPDEQAWEREAPATETPEGIAEQSADPFKGEVPALAVTRKPQRRFSDKVIRLAEHRLPANDKGLTPLERVAFREIGEQLKRTSDDTAGETKAAAPVQPEAGAMGVTAERDEGPDPEASETLIAPSEPTDQTELPSPAREAELARAVSDQMEDGADAPPPAAHLPEGSDAAETAETALQSLEPEKTLGTVEAPVSDTVEAVGEAAEAAPPELRAYTAQSDELAGKTDRPSSALATENPTTPEAGDHTGETITPSERVSRSLLDFAAPQDKLTGESSGPATEPVAEAEPTQAAAAARAAQSADAAQTAGIEEADAPPEGEATLVDDRDADVATEISSPTDESQSTTPAEMPAATPRPLKQDGFLPSAFAERASGASRADTSILEQLPIPVLIHSGDTLHYANDAFLALTGYESVEDLAERGGLDELLSGPAEDRKEGDNRVMLKPRTGEQFPVSAFLQSVPWLGGKALLLTVTRQPGAPTPLPAASPPQESELPARIAELRTILDTATDGVVLIANDGSVRSISRPAEALFGYDGDQVVGKPFTSLFAIESQRAARDYLAGLSDNGVASVLNDGREVIGREAQGRFIPLFMTIGRLPGDSGYCAVLRDITQWKRAEEDLTQARAQAERTSSQKSDFLARVSHEIRTPLNAIIGFSELMLDEKFGPVANDRYRDYLRDINRSGNHVLDLVNDLLDISKIEAGQQDMDYEAVALNDSLTETVAMMQPQANRERVIIRSSFAAKLPEVVADLRSVRQIALNILSNAVRYTQAGGQVIVSTAYEPNGEVVMRVRDTGIGMSQAEIEQALKPFKQINSLKRARGDGTGLGLPLTKAMVEANRAKFAIYSTPGEGTLVEVTFPSTRVLAE